MRKTERSRRRIAQGGFVLPTPEELAGARHTAAQLTEWGVPWPPPSGWRRALCERISSPAETVWNNATRTAETARRRNTCFQCGGICGSEEIMVTGCRKADGSLNVFAFRSSDCRDLWYGAHPI